MKKPVIRCAYFALVGTLLSCSVESEIAPPEHESIPESYVVTVDEARANVENLLADLDVQTRGGSPRTISETIVTGGFGATRAADGEDAPLYYIFNLADEQGYAMASGDTRTPSVFFVTDSGRFDLEELAQNPGALMTLISYDTDYRVSVGLPILKPDGNGWINPGEPGYPGGVGWLDDTVKSYDRYITIDGRPVDDRPLTIHTGPWTTSKEYGTVIAAEWGQGAPYNDKYPYWSGTTHAAAGCGVTAVAQILYHYGYPSSIDDGRGTTHSLDWELMRQHIRHVDEDDVVNAHLNHQPAHENIATLFQELSRSRYLNVSYADSDEKNATSVGDPRIAKTFRKLGFSTNDEAEYNVNAVFDAMKRGMPVIVGGYSHRTPVNFLGMTLWYNYSGGHFWICDQLRVRTREVRYYREDELIKTEKQVQNLLHCNWGWDGNFTGYFLPTKFESDNPIMTRSEGADGLYRYDITMWDWITR